MDEKRTPRRVILKPFSEYNMRHPIYPKKSTGIIAPRPKAYIKTFDINSPTVPMGYPIMPNNIIMANTITNNPLISLRRVKPFPDAAFTFFAVAVFDVALRTTRLRCVLPPAIFAVVLAFPAVVLFFRSAIYTVHSYYVNL